MKKVRMLNGYRVIYEPKHPSSMKSENWNGWIYEHIFLAEKMMKRKLLDNEVVHHLDGQRDNNDITNLLVLYRCQHTKLHEWLKNGAFNGKPLNENGVKTGKSKSNRYCKTCDIQISKTHKKYCSDKCQKIDYRKVERPSKEDLKTLLESNSFLALGRKYGVSDNSVRRWARQYDLI